MKLHNQQKSLQNQNNHNTLLDSFTAQYSETSLYCMAMACNTNQDIIATNFEDQRKQH
jgi:hypothetical protein